MTREQALQTLGWLTHSWRPTPWESPANLAAARRAIALTLLKDQVEILVYDGGVPPPADLDPAIVGDIVHAVDDAIAAIAASPISIPPKVFLRTLPIVTHHNKSSVPPWAAGRLQIGTLGPFSDSREFRFWVDTYEPVSHITFARGGSNLPFLLIPIESAFSSQEGMEVAGGTVWILSQAFDQRANFGYVGLQVLGGSLRFDGPTHGSGPIQLDPQGSVTLTLDLVPQPTTGPGAIGVQLPEQVTLRLTPVGVDTIETADLSLQIDAGVFTLRRAEAPARYERALASILIPYDVEPGQISAANPPKSFHTLDGNASLQGGGWTLPISQNDADRLGEASGIGALALVVGDGLTAAWTGLRGGPVHLKRTFIEVAPGLLTIVAPGAQNRRTRHHVQLWQESGKNRRSSIDLSYDKPYVLTLLSSHEGVEAVLANAAVAAHLDRPLHASGARTGFRDANATLRWIADASGARLHMAAVVEPGFSILARPKAIAALAISNALFRTTPAEALFVTGRVDADSDAFEGALLLIFGLHGVVPTLPDPYAANLEIPVDRIVDPAPASLIASVRWSTPLVPHLAVSTAVYEARGILPALLPRPLPAAGPRQDDDLLPRLRSLFNTSVGARGAENVRLLDLSTNADQLGVGLGFGRLGTFGRPDLAIRDLDLVTPGTNVRVLMLPQVQWEPVVTPPGPTPFPEKLYSVDDGGPSLIGASTVQLIPVAPVPAASELLKVLEDGETSGAVLFTLPFGIKAVATVSHQQLAAHHRPLKLRANQPTFGELQSARQFSLDTGAVSTDGTSAPGASLQLLNAIERFGFERFSVIGKGLGSIRHTFNETFGPEKPRAGVPISRIDLSGYGQSGFSFWADKTPVAFPKITEARFDVVGGRTAYEVIQEMSVCWPWQAIFVRTITIQRKGNARVIRSDSGWVAATPGVFRLPGFPDVFHPGVVKGFYNITAIREFGPVVQPPGAAGTAFQPVYFNADAAIEHVVAGQRGAGIDENGEPVHFVPVQQMVGYVQRLPLAPLTPPQLNALFESQGAIGGPIDCEVDVGRSGFRMRVNSVAASPAFGGEFAVAARGMPRLPASGQWSVTRTDNTANGDEHNEPQPVDRSAVPLTRKGKATVANGVNNEAYRFAEPMDLLAPGPRFDYGILFATEVFRVLFPRPRIDVGVNHLGNKQIATGVRPLLADPYTVITTTSIFPKGAQCLRFPEMPSLDVLPGENLRLRPTTFKVEPFRVREQVKTANWRMALEYADPTGAHLTTVALTLDSTATPPATLTMSPLNTVVDRDPFKSLMRIAGKLEAKSPATFTDAEVVLGSVLAPVSTVITFLRDLQLPLALAATMAASDDKSWAWKQELHIDLVKILRHLLQVPAPGEERKTDRINLGFCKFRGDLKIGMFISFCGKQRAGVFIEQVGEFQQSIIGNLLYGGGYFRFQLAFELEEERTAQDVKTSKDRTVIELAAAGAASLGGQLIPNRDIIKAEANVRYGYLLELEISASPPVIKPGVIVGMEVEAEILDGLFAAGFEWEGKALMTRDGDEIEIDAEVTAAVSITVAWAFEETIEIEGEFKTRIDEKVVAGLLVALGFVPI